ncbi:MAG TPA: DUF5908 family protein [Myxococcota bacterium]|nr:DUF5908 family protein [Myxococcota bacterium]HND32545.1 DUF5908 family protein [Myxococcota bacterium]
MTIEIRQLVIRAVVQPTPAPLPERSAPVVRSAAPAADPHLVPPLPTELLISTCVREVLRRLDRARER